MTTEPINKSMDREDLITDAGQAFTQKLDALRAKLEARHLPVTSWYGGLPPARPGLSSQGLKAAAKKLLGHTVPAVVIGEENRGGPEYEPVPSIEDDDRHPWFLYWEAFWVAHHGPAIGPGSKVLDAGGTASLFSCYLASTGAEVHSIDLNPRLVEAGRTISRSMGWNLHSYAMNMRGLEFPDASFDHAFSICVFEHLEFELRQVALAEIARVLRPGGMLCLTFDYGGPGVALALKGYTTDPEHLLDSPEAVMRSFGHVEGLEVVGNPEFHDNGKSYLRAPTPNRDGYSFGAIFLRKKS